MTHQGAGEHLAELALARSAIDRAAHRRTDDEWLVRAWADPRTRVFRFCGARAAVMGVPPALELTAPPAGSGDARYFLGVDDDGIAYFALDIDDSAAAAQDYRGLREVGPLLPARDAGLMVHAIALGNWHATHTHCPRCGSPTRSSAAGHLRRCETDGSEHYPRTDPAVIMAVVDRDSRVLLGRQPRWEPGRFSALAGFVEPGESLEQAVRREVAEEVGVVIGAVRYLGSQPWPFPSSLMLGFVATAETVDITLRDGEIEQAQWFSRAALAEHLAAGDLRLPPPVSIASRLLEHWYGEPLPGAPDELPQAASRSLT